MEILFLSAIASSIRAVSGGMPTSIKPPSNGFMIVSLQIVLAQRFYWVLKQRGSAEV